MTQRILVIRFGSLGDVVLTSAPALNLKLAFPDSTISYFTKDQFRPVLAHFDSVDEIRTFNSAPSAPTLYQTALELDRQKFDLVVDLHGNFRSWFTRTMVSSPQSTVYPKHWHERRQIVQKKQCPDPPIHAIDSYNACLEGLGFPVPARRPVFNRRTSSAVPGLVAWTHPYVVIVPGAAHANKQWPIGQFAEVALHLHQDRSLGIVWAVTSTDQSKSGLEKIIAPDRFMELVDEPFESLVSVFAGAQMTITNDSGLMHLSSAVGTPVLGIFGPTHPALGFSPRGFRDRVIQVDEPCRPCSMHGKTPCYRSERFCFTRISASMVLEVAEHMLDQSNARTPALFLDRDGTVMADKQYLTDPEQVELLPMAGEALSAAKRRGYKLVVLSNQSGVARGMFGLSAVERVNARLKQLLSQQGVVIDAMYYCPHFPGGKVAEFSLSCDCRKPAPGMAEQAARDLNIDLRKSVVIGDKLDDLNLARVLGVTGILVRTGHGSETENQLNAQCRVSTPIADSLHQAMEYLR